MRDQSAKDAYRLIRTTAEAARKGSSQAQSAAKAPDAAALLEDVVHWLDDAKAEEIVSIPLKGKSSLGDFMVVASGRNDRHVGAIAEQLRDKLKARGEARVRVGRPYCGGVSRIGEGECSADPSGAGGRG